MVGLSRAAKTPDYLWLPKSQGDLNRFIVVAIAPEPEQLINDLDSHNGENESRMGVFHATGGRIFREIQLRHKQVLDRSQLTLSGRDSGVESNPDLPITSMRLDARRP